MPCSDCGYTLPTGQTDCPRCRYRRHIRETMAAPALPAQENAPSSPPEPVAGMHWNRQSRAALFLAVVLLLVIFGITAIYRTRSTPEARAGVIFARSDGPCRDGVQATCQDGMTALTTMRDHSDAALLLGDLRVTRYLQNRPGSTILLARWRRDDLTAAELTALGYETQRLHLPVFHSFWMYAFVKQNQMTVPTLAINNDAPKF